MDVPAGLSICAAVPKAELRLWFLGGKTASKPAEYTEGTSQPVGHPNPKTWKNDTGGSRPRNGKKVFPRTAEGVKFGS
jgi:hypothetical protein